MYLILRLFAILSAHYYQAFAQAFAKAGAKALVLVARNAAGLEAAAQEVKEVNPEIQVLTQAMDIRSEDEVKKLFSRIKSEIGAVDVLVNNAGSGKSALPVRDVSPDNFWYDFVSISTLSGNRDR